MIEQVDLAAIPSMNYPVDIILVRRLSMTKTQASSVITIAGQRRPQASFWVVVDANNTPYPVGMVIVGSTFQGEPIVWHNQLYFRFRLDNIMSWITRYSDTEKEIYEIADIDKIDNEQGA